MMLQPLSDDSHNITMSLHLAARLGDLKNVKYKIETGEFVDDTDLFGSTALHLAAMYDHPEVTEYLIQSLADINAKTYYHYYETDDYDVEYSFTPLDLAALYAPNIHSLSLLVSNAARSADLNILVDYLVENW